MKMMSLLFCLFVCASFVGFATAANGTSCCQTGFYMKMNRTLPAFYCENNVTKEIQPSVLECKSSNLTTELKLPFRVNEAGEILITQAGGEQVSHGSCVGQLNVFLSKSNKFVVLGAIGLCNPEPPLMSKEAKAWCLLVSAAFLYVTALIYLSLSELRDLEGKSIASLCVSLASGFIVLAILSLTKPDFDSPGCLVEACFGYGFLVAAFCWMNVIAVQILLKIRRGTSTDHNCREFVYYSVYAWGVAVALVVLMVILDKVEGPHTKPGIGLASCWFYSLNETWRYLYSVMSITLIVNLIIFVYIGVGIWRSKFTSDLTKALRYKCWVMLKLYIIMGLPWLFEMLNIYLPSGISTVIDILNALVGVLFFLVLVVLRPRAVKALRKRNLLCCAASLADRLVARADDHEAKAISHTAVMTLDDNHLNSVQK